MNCVEPNKDSIIWLTKSLFILAAHMYISFYPPKIISNSQSFILILIMVWLIRQNHILIFLVYIRHDLNFRGEIWFYFLFHSSLWLLFHFQSGLFFLLYLQELACVLFTYLSLLFIFASVMSINKQLIKWQLINFVGCCSRNYKYVF